MTGVEFLAFCLAPIMGIFGVLAVVDPTVAILSVPVLFIVTVAIMGWWCDRHG